MRCAHGDAIDRGRDLGRCGSYPAQAHSGPAEHVEHVMKKVATNMDDILNEKWEFG
jgi:hypothetical protein